MFRALELIELSATTSEVPALPFRSSFGRGMPGSRQYRPGVGCRDLTHTLTWKQKVWYLIQQVRLLMAMAGCSISKARASVKTSWRRPSGGFF